jgi:hypothetical protein
MNRSVLGVLAAAGVLAVVLGAACGKAKSAGDEPKAKELSAEFPFDEETEGAKAAELPPTSPSASDADEDAAKAEEDIDDIDVETDLEDDAEADEDDGWDEDGEAGDDADDDADDNADDAEQAEDAEIL